MYSPTLKSSIIQLIKNEYPYWVGGNRLEKLAFELHYKAENAMRRGRELVSEGLIEKGYTEEGWVKYKYILPKPISREEEERDILMTAIQ